MSIMTIQRVPSRVSLGGGYIANPFSRTMRSQYAVNKVNAAMQSSGNWMQAAPVGRGMRGLGGLGAWTDGIPTWAPWAVGGAVVAGVIGFFVFRKKGRR